MCAKTNTSKNMKKQIMKLLTSWLQIEHLKNKFYKIKVRKVGQM